MEQDEEVKEIKTVVRTDPEKDLVSLYFLARRNLTEVKDSFAVYELLVQVITVGSGLIADADTKAEIMKFLTDDKNYPKLTDMEFQPDSHTYSVGTGQSGIISVRPEDLDVGRNHFKDQQLNTIIPKLRLIDSKVLGILIKEGVIQKYSMKQIIEKRAMEELL